MFNASRRHTAQRIWNEIAERERQIADVCFSSYSCAHDTYVVCLLCFVSLLKQGGCTKFRGFGQRLLEEMQALAPRDSKVRIHAPPDRLYSAYTGGSILASLSATFRSMAVTRSEYFDNGASILHRKTL